MSNPNKEKPKSILEALGARGEEMGPEPTVDEDVMGALSEASLMDTLESEQYPEGPPQGANQEKPKFIVPLSAMEKQTTPA